MPIAWAVPCFIFSPTPGQIIFITWWCSLWKNTSEKGRIFKSSFQNGNKDGHKEICKTLWNLRTFSCHDWAARKGEKSTGGTGCWKVSTRNKSSFWGKNIGTFFFFGPQQHLPAVDLCSSCAFCRSPVVPHFLESYEHLFRVSHMNDSLLQDTDKAASQGKDFGMSTDPGDRAEQRSHCSQGSQS